MTAGFPIEFHDEHSAVVHDPPLHASDLMESYKNTRSSPKTEAWAHHQLQCLELHVTHMNRDVAGVQHRTLQMSIMFQQMQSICERYFNCTHFKSQQCFRFDQSAKDVSTEHTSNLSNVSDSINLRKTFQLHTLQISIMFQQIQSICERCFN